MTLSSSLDLGGSLWKLAVYRQIESMRKMLKAAAAAADRKESQQRDRSNERIRDMRCGDEASETGRRHFLTDIPLSALSVLSQISPPPRSHSCLPDRVHADV